MVMNADTRDLVESACAQLAERTGLHVGWDQGSDRAMPSHGADAAVTVGGERGVEIRFAAAARPRLTAQTMHQAVAAVRRYASMTGSLPLIVADYVNPNIAQQLRRENLNYIDLAGNAYLRAPSLLVDIQGRKPAVRPVPRLLGAKALQLVGALLLEPHTINKTSRQLSRDAGIALGSVSMALRQLEEKGFVIRTGPHQLGLNQQERLLDLWLQGYADVLRPRLTRRTYRLHPSVGLDRLHVALAEAGVSDVLVGGEAAAAFYTKYLSPATATLHVFSDETALPKDLLLPDISGNVTVLRMFGNMHTWSGAGVLSGADALAHPMLVYTELLAISGPDGRAAETAELLRSQFEFYREAQHHE